MSRRFDHSGHREAGGLVGRGLPFERVNPTRPGAFAENSACVLIRYLSLPSEKSGSVRNGARNSVENLSWSALDDSVAALATTEG